MWMIFLGVSGIFMLSIQLYKFEFGLELDPILTVVFKIITQGNKTPAIKPKTAETILKIEAISKI